MTNDTPSRNKRNAQRGSGDSKGYRLILEYSGLAAKYLVVLGISVWAGLRLDQMVPMSFPLFVWLLPLLCIIGLIVKAVLDTSK
jgi:hypothetical protein